MKITKFEIFRYDLPLIVPIQLNNVQIKKRSGLLIKICGEQGHSAIGEITPLPGLHEENLEEALKNLNDVTPSLLNSAIPLQLEKLEFGFEDWIGGKELLPSVRFGLEMAVLNLLAERYDKSLGRLLSADCQKQIEINGLVLGEKDEVVNQVKELIQEGYRTIKMKVGHNSIDEEIRTVNELCEIIDERAQLRLDANRRWSFAEAVKFAKSVSPASIEYIEEPFGDLKLWSSFFDQTGMPVALDESLKGQPIDQLENFKGLKAFIIKPSIIGGFERSMKFVRKAKARGIYSVISSAFESGLGLTALADFAASLNPGNIAMGLDTKRWLEKDLLKTDLKTRSGKLDVKLAYNLSKKINYELLKNLAKR